MRYIKLFESSDALLDTNIINDILQEVIDLEYECRVKTDWSSNPTTGNSYQFTIYGRDKIIGDNPNYTTKFIKKEDIIEPVQKIVNFLKQYGYVLSRSTLPSDDSLKNYNKLLSKDSDIIKWSFSLSFESKNKK